MTTNDAIKLIENAGTTITKEKLLDKIRLSPTKEYPFSKESGSVYAVVKILL